MLAPTYVYATRLFIYPSHECLDGVHNQFTAYWAHGLLGSTLGTELVGANLAHAQVLTRQQHHTPHILHAHNAHNAYGVLQ